MKNEYTKLTTEILVVESEDGFMAGSAYACSVTVEDYHAHNFGTEDSFKDTFEVGFGE